MWHLFIILILIMEPTVRALICTRHPANTATPKSPVDENYVISITGNPETYILGQEYNVSLNAFNGHRYISFSLALENENGNFNYSDDLGRFELSDMIETRFSPNCINMVENTNTNPKTHMHLTWTAPSQPGSGCILMRATVVQHRDVWHMDDGGLTRRICEEVVDDVESQPVGHQLNSPCCACDEARYELTFEGAWSRNLHHKDFPTRGWETRFCELVGASHSSDYRFWESGVLASEGVKQYAEHCTAQLLEREFSINFRDQKIRTIIKARGPAFPHLNSTTTATVRVDPIHHMVSFASKIEPSPDWILGISGLELCLRNCTWLESKVINLYPWDVGTDAGPSYMSPDQPQVPPDVIRRIRSDFPNDPRSPFYDENGAPMKPMAMLTVKRQRSYERRCLDEDSNNYADVPRECLTHPWSGWSDCSSKCGEGMQYRRRVYKQPELARIYNCNVPQYEERACEGQVCGQSEPMRNLGEFDEYNMGMPQNMQQSKYQRLPECQLSVWSEWGSCSVTCGEGYQIRQRQYINPNAEFKCQNVHRLDLQQRRKCAGRACLGNLSGSGPVGSGMESAYEERERMNPNFEPEPYDKQNNNFNRDYNERLTDESRRPFSFDVSNLKGSRDTYDKHSNNFNSDYEERPTDDGRRPSAFDVGNLKRSQAQWDQTQRSDAQWPPNNQFPQKAISGQIYETDRNPAGEYGQMPRLDDIERGSWQRPRRPDDNFKQEEDRYSTQRQRTGNRYADAETEREQRPSYNNNFDKGFEDINAQDTGDDFDVYLSKRCFRMLQTNQPRCRNQTVVGNFWFYNFCADECMLFAADPCDHNVNKFNKFEACEACRRPEFQQLQGEYALSPECQSILASQRVQQRYWEEQRGSNSRRRINNNRQRR